MKKYIQSVALMFFVVFFFGCFQNRFRSGNERFYLNPQQVKKLERKASNGDQKAAQKLSTYYAFYEQDEERADFWRKLERGQEGTGTGSGNGVSPEWH
ncbi:MAG: hypothetical protein WC334_02015 [Kiritimatiellales bacterium]|jgi:hypothetical protein